MTERVKLALTSGEYAQKRAWFRQSGRSFKIFARINFDKYGATEQELKIFFFPTYYSILQFSNHLPIILLESSIIIYLPPLFSTPVTKVLIIVHTSTHVLYTRD